MFINTPFIGATISAMPVDDSNDAREVHASVKRLLEAAVDATRDTRRPINFISDLGAYLAGLDPPVTPARFTNWKRRGVSKDFAIVAGKLFGCSADWILNGGDENAPRRHKPAAHRLSFSEFTVPKKPMSWGDLMTTNFDDVFEAVLADNAMAPEFPAGLVVRFDKRKTPEFGNRVLIRDSSGNYHFRMYAQAVHDSWQGKPTSDAFRSIEPSRDGATVIAVKDGHYVQGA